MFGLAILGWLAWVVFSHPGQARDLLAIAKTDDRLRLAVTNTILITAVCLTLQVLSVAGLAAILTRATDQMLIALAAPVLVAPSCAAVAWFLFTSPVLTPLSPLLSGLGLESSTLYTSRLGMLISVAIIDTWQWAPFATSVVLFQLSRLPRSYFEQGRLEGATGLRMLLRVSIPLITPTLVVLAIVRLFDLLRSYDIIWTLFGDGGPGRALETISIYGRVTSFQTGRESYGALIALGYLLGTILLLAMALRSRSLERLMPWRVANVKS